MEKLPAQTRISRVRLRVADLEQAATFYQGLLGLRPVEEAPGRLALSATGDPPWFVMLEELPGARPKPPGTTGLYHVALLLPDRRELARLLRRFVAAGWPLQGLSDHGVSEAVYLADPDGNGLELYADRPRERWAREGGEVAMFTRRLDVAGLMAELERRPEEAGEPALHPATRVGHVHLHVSRLDRSEAFYAGALGLEVTNRSYPGALFLAAGGYHHHLGLNVWQGVGAPPPPAEAVGLIDFALAVPDAAAAAAAAERLRRAGWAAEPEAAGYRTADPDGIGVVIAVEAGDPIRAS